MVPGVFGEFTHNSDRFGLIAGLRGDYTSFYKKYFSKSPLNDNNVIIPFIFLFIVEIFPIKSTGSFFTTGSTTYLILIIAILIGIVRHHYSIENKL